MIANSESWIGLNNSHIERMQKVQDGYFMKVFQVSNLGTPNCMVQLDSQTLKIKWQILLRKIKQIRKTLDKQSTNICKQALIQRQSMCDREDLLTECITWCKKLGIRCVTKGTDIDKENEQADNLKLKRGLWGEMVKK